MATMLHENGATMKLIQDVGFWKNASTAEGYIQDSNNNKRTASNLLQQKAKKPRAGNASQPAPTMAQLELIPRQASVSEAIQAATPANPQDGMNTAADIVRFQSRGMITGPISNCTITIIQGNQITNNHK